MPITSSTGIGSGVHHSTGWLWFRLGGILWKDSGQQGEGEGHLKFLDEPPPPKINPEVYNTPEARTYQTYVAATTFSALLLVGIVCMALYWGLMCIRGMRKQIREGMLKGPICASALPHLFSKDKYLIDDCDVEASIGEQSMDYNSNSSNHDSADTTTKTNEGTMNQQANVGHY